MRDLKPERRQQTVPFVFARCHSLYDVAATAGLGTRIPGRPPLHQGNDHEGVKWHPRIVATETGQEFECLFATIELRYHFLAKDVDAANMFDRNDGQQNAPEHGQQELNHISNCDSPHTGQRRIESDDP